MLHATCYMPLGWVKFLKKNVDFCTNMLRGKSGILIFKLRNLRIFLPFFPHTHIGSLCRHSSTAAQQHTTAYSICHCHCYSAEIMDYVVNFQLALVTICTNLSLLVLQKILLEILFFLVMFLLQDK